MDSERLRVIVATEPRVYRDVLAGALRLLRPEIEVLLATPAELAVLLETAGPHLVIASDRPGRAVAMTWVTLYPEGRQRAFVRIGDVERESQDLDLNEILGPVDHLTALLTASRASTI